MKKSILIIITLLLLSFSVFWIFFYKGTLIININPGPAKVIIDKKEYDNIDHLKVNIRARRHNIKIVKENYKDFSETISIPFWKERIVNIALELTEEARAKEETESIAKKIANSWISYSDEKSNEFLNQVKPYLSEDAYNSLVLNIKLSKTPNSQGIITELPKVSGPIKNTDFLEVETNSISIRINTSRDPEIDSTSSLDFELRKIDDKWQVINIIYNY